MASFIDNTQEVTQEDNSYKEYTFQYKPYQAVSLMHNIFGHDFAHDYNGKTTKRLEPILKHIDRVTESIGIKGGGVRNPSIETKTNVMTKIQKLSEAEPTTESKTESNTESKTESNTSRLESINFEDVEKFEESLSKKPEMLYYLDILRKDLSSCSRETNGYNEFHYVSHLLDKMSGRILNADLKNKDEIVNILKDSKFREESGEDNANYTSDLVGYENIWKEIVNVVTDPDIKFVKDSVSFFTLTSIGELLDIHDELTVCISFQMDDDIKEESTEVTGGRARQKSQTFTAKFNDTKPKSEQLNVDAIKNKTTKGMKAVKILSSTPQSPQTSDSSHKAICEIMFGVMKDRANIHLSNYMIILYCVYFMYSANDLIPQEVLLSKHIRHTTVKLLFHRPIFEILYPSGLSSPTRYEKKLDDVITYIKSHPDIVSKSNQYQNGGANEDIKSFVEFVENTESYKKISDYYYESKLDEIHDLSEEVKDLEKDLKSLESKIAPKDGDFRYLEEMFGKSGNARKLHNHNNSIKTKLYGIIFKIVEKYNCELKDKNMRIEIKEQLNKAREEAGKFTSIQKKTVNNVSKMVISNILNFIEPLSENEDLQTFEGKHYALLKKAKTGSLQSIDNDLMKIFKETYKSSIVADGNVALVEKHLDKQFPKKGKYMINNAGLINKVGRSQEKHVICPPSSVLDGMLLCSFNVARKNNVFVHGNTFFRLEDTDSSISYNGFSHLLPNNKEVSVGFFASSVKDDFDIPYTHKIVNLVSGVELQANIVYRNVSMTISSTIERLKQSVKNVTPKLINQTLQNQNVFINIVRCGAFKNVGDLFQEINMIQKPIVDSNSIGSKLPLKEMLGTTNDQPSAVRSFYMLLRGIENKNENIRKEKVGLMYIEDKTSVFVMPPGTFEEGLELSQPSKAPQARKTRGRKSKKGGTRKNKK